MNFTLSGFGMPGMMFFSIIISALRAFPIYCSADYRRTNCFQRKYYNSCVDIAYYVMFQAATAVLFKAGFRLKSEKIGHNSIQAEFSRAEDKIFFPNPDDKQLRKVAG